MRALHIKLQQPQTLALIAVVVISGFMGLYFLVSSYAATPTANIEPESGSKTAGASAITDSSASGSSAIKFSTPPAAGTCPNAQHMPGGPDGMGGCWPYEGNTGIPTGTNLTAYSGPCTITTANTVIDSKLINCGLSIQAANVTIRKSQVNGGINLSQCGNGWSFHVEDSRIHMNDLNYRGLQSCDYTALRVDVTGGQSMAWCNNCTIQDSFLHAPLEDPTGIAHNSTVRMAAYATLRHNTFWCNVAEYVSQYDTSGCSANQTGYSHDGSPPHNSLVEANLYMPTSGGYCSYGGSTSGQLDQVHDIVFKDNIFRKTAPGYPGGPNCGYWGASTSFDPNRPGNQWINNRWSDGSILNSTL